MHLSSINLVQMLSSLTYNDSMPRYTGREPPLCPGCNCGDALQLNRSGGWLLFFLLFFLPYFGFFLSLFRGEPLSMRAPWARGPLEQGGPLSKGAPLSREAPWAHCKPKLMKMLALLREHNYFKPNSYKLKKFSWINSIKFSWTNRKFISVYICCQSV